MDKGGHFIARAFAQFALGRGARGLIGNVVVVSHGHLPEEEAEF